MYLRQWTAFCTKNAAYMAKMKFNTGIETLTIFLVSVAAAVHWSFVLYYSGSPAVPARNGTRRLKGVTQKGESHRLNRTLLYRRSG
jgi:hypothetical protein